MLTLVRLSAFWRMPKLRQNHDNLLCRNGGVLLESISERLLRLHRLSWHGSHKPSSSLWYSHKSLQTTKGLLGIFQRANNKTHFWLQQMNHNGKLRYLRCLHSWELKHWSIRINSHWLTSGISQSGTQTHKKYLKKLQTSLWVSHLNDLGKVSTALRGNDHWVHGCLRFLSYQNWSIGGFDLDSHPILYN